MDIALILKMIIDVIVTLVMVEKIAIFLVHLKTHHIVLQTEPASGKITLRVVIFSLFKSILRVQIIVLCVKKPEKSMSWLFYNPLWSFLANYINIFHKTELQTIILMCLTCVNLIWIKSYNIKHNFLFFLQFCKKKKKNTENL